MIKVNRMQLEQILKLHKFSVVLIDASWNKVGKPLRDKMIKVETDYKNIVSFCFIDCDEESVFSREIGIMNVPSVAYYYDSELKTVIIGDNQDVKANIENLLMN